MPEVTAPERTATPVLATSKAVAERRARPIQRLVSGGYVVAASAALFLVVSHLVNDLLLDGRVFNLDADQEGNAFAWAAAMATFAAAFAALLLALASRRPGAPAALAGVLVFFSLDDGVAVHERIAGRLADALGFGVSSERVIWPAVFLPLLAAALLLLLRLARAAPRRPRRAILHGLGLLVFAIAAEVVSVAIDPRGTANAVEVALEEGAELGGWLLVASGLTALAWREIAGEGPA